MGCWIGGLVGWWIGGLVGWWVSGLVGWWVGGLVSWWVGGKWVGWLVVGWLVSWLDLFGLLDACPPVRDKDAIDQEVRQLQIFSFPGTDPGWSYPRPGTNCEL